MATQTFTTDSESVDDIRSSERGHAAVTGINRYQLNVIASSTADVVRSAGGWMCDRVRAGWDVNVLAADRLDPRPLAILGATALGPDAEFGSVARSMPRGGALAVSTDLLGTDPHIRAEVLRILRRGLTEVTVWGEALPAELGRTADPVQHQMSAAAKAFKAHALAAAAVSHDSIGTETLFRIGTGSLRPLYSV